MSKLSKEKFLELSRDIKEKTQEAVVKISEGSNKKLGFIPSVNLPALFTCRGCGCNSECYCLHYPMASANAIKSHWRNLNQYLKDSESYFNQIIYYLNNPIKTYKYFRWHSSGDIVDYKYFVGVVKVARECKNTNFLIFTKKFEIVNEWLDQNKELPSNLNVVLSHWDKTFKVENPYNLLCAYINFGDSRNEEIPKSAVPCSGDCSTCGGCWMLKKNESVVFDLH